MLGTYDLIKSKRVIIYFLKYTNYREGRVFKGVEGQEFDILYLFLSAKQGEYLLLPPLNPFPLTSLRNGKV